MVYLLDADAFIAAEQGTFDLFAWIEAHPEDEMMVASVTVAELRFTVESADGNRRIRRERLIDRLLEVLEVLPYTERAIEYQVRIRREQRGKGVSERDQMLAAMALEHRANILTLDPSRFAGIEYLHAVKPA